MTIDRTFVPWASVWLFYFEEWLASILRSGSLRTTGKARERITIRTEIQLKPVVTG